MQTQKLNEGIAQFYDESSGLWESMWGEHMHHGKTPHQSQATEHMLNDLFRQSSSLELQGTTPKAVLPRAIRRLR